MGANLGAEAILQRGDDPPAVGVVLRVGAGHHEHIEREAEHVAADLDIALLHHVEHRDLDAFGQVGQLVDGDDAAVAARDQAEVDGLRIPQAPTLRDLHRIDITDQVGHTRVGGGELLGIPLVPAAPGDRQVVSQLGGAAHTRYGDGFEGMLAELGVLDHRTPLIEQPDHRAQQAGLALPALTKKHDVVAGDEGPLELRDDGGCEAVQPRPRVAALAERGEKIVADLDAQRLLHMAGRPELADGCLGGSYHLNKATPPPTSDRSEYAMVPAKAKGWSMDCTLRDSARRVRRHSVRNEDRYSGRN